MRFSTAAIAITAFGLLVFTTHSQATAMAQPGVAALNRMQIYSAQALADVEEARAAMNSGDGATVALDLDKTQVLLELIRAHMPAAEFHAMLRALQAEMDFEDNAQVLPMFRRLFYALDDLPNSTATAQARAALDQARKDLGKPNRAAALLALQQADDAFTDPLLTPPLQSAEHDLATANRALTTGNRGRTSTKLGKLAADLLDLHRALATYPIEMPQNASATTG